MGGGERAALRARADPDLGPARGPAGFVFFFFSGRAQCAGSARMLSARAVLPATGIGSARPGKASCALMTLEAESPILGTGMGPESSLRALLAAESMGSVSVPPANLRTWPSLRGKVS